MPRSCLICQHPDRESIDKALARQASNRELARIYSLSEASVRRHRSNHLPARMVMAEKAAELVEADNLLDQVGDLQRRALGILDRAEEAGELKTALSAIREARGNLELLAKLLGELDERPVMNLNISPEWLQLRAVIVGALEPHPEALGAVVGALEAAEDG